MCFSACYVFWSCLQNVASLKNDAFSADDALSSIATMSCAVSNAPREKNTFYLQKS